VTKVVTFGAFVEILPGVEGLVHISELANHHVENPREVVSQGDPVNVLILEIDGDRRRLSLSLKRVEEGAVPVPRADGAESVHSTPDLKLSEEAFPSSGAAAVEEAEEASDAEEVVEAEAVEVTEEVEDAVEAAEAAEVTEAAEVAEEAEVAEDVVEETADETVAEVSEPEEQAGEDEPEPDDQAAEQS